jgi:uncharacterized protein (DUF1697 family)
VLLRGINVGRAKRVAMADLRALLSGLGHTDVATLLNSGNVALTAAGDPAGLATQVHDAVLAELGVDSRVLVMTRDEVAAALTSNPLTGEDGSRMLALLLSAEPDPALEAAHDALALDPDRTARGPRVVHQWCPDGVLAAPPVAAFVEKHWGVAVTGRNRRTLEKLLTLLDR